MCIYIVAMKASLQKWGNSLALRIPAAMAKQISVREGDSVELSIRSNTLMIKPAAPSYDLARLVQKISRENLHDETAWGSAKGREVW